VIGTADTRKNPFRTLFISLLLLKPDGLPFLHQALRHEENPACRMLLTKHASAAKDEHWRLTR
jgi:hypothetical protein